MSIIPPLPDIAKFSMKYFILSKVYTDEGGIIVIPLSHVLSTCMGDNPFA